MEIEKAVCAQSCDQIFDQEEAKGMFSDTKGLSLAQLILLNVEIDALCFWPSSCAPLTYIYMEKEFWIRRGTYWMCTFCSHLMICPICAVL